MLRLCSSAFAIAVAPATPILLSLSLCMEPRLGGHVNARKQATGGIDRGKQHRRQRGRCQRNTTARRQQQVRRAGAQRGGSVWETIAETGSGPSQRPLTQASGCCCCARGPCRWQSHLHHQSCYHRGWSCIRDGGTVERTGTVKANACR